MTNEERISYALTVIGNAGLVLSYKYSEYADQLTVTIALPEKAPPVEAFEVLRAAVNGSSASND